MEFVPKNLLELLEEAAGGLDKSVVRSTIRQLCRAIGYLHKHAVLYRDVKPENILIDSTGNLKLCDFGFARRWTAGSAEILTDYVATRWYRAPELLLGPPFVNAQGAKARTSPLPRPLPRSFTRKLPTECRGRSEQYHLCREKVADTSPFCFAPNASRSARHTVHPRTFGQSVRSLARSSLPQHSDQVISPLPHPSTSAAHS